MQLENRVALVTGGGGGIGRATCLRFAREGAALARYNITVNAIAPGATRTRMTDVILEQIKANLIQRIPLKRMAEPEEIAALHLFLASEEASYITGQVIFCDGGVTVGH